MTEKIKLNVQCRFNDDHFMSFEVNVKDWEEWKTGGRTGRKIQDIFPYLRPEQREIMISGMCNICWNNTFSKIDE